MRRAISRSVSMSLSGGLDGADVAWLGRSGGSRRITAGALARSAVTASGISRRRTSRRTAEGFAAAPAMTSSRPGPTLSSSVRTSQASVRIPPAIQNFSGSMVLVVVSRKEP
jgi:hypothetical protein